MAIKKRLSLEENAAETDVMRRALDCCARERLTDPLRELIGAFHGAPGEGAKAHDRYVVKPRRGEGSLLIDSSTPTMTCTNELLPSISASRGQYDDRRRKPSSRSAIRFFAITWVSRLPRAGSSISNPPGP